MAAALDLADLAWLDAYESSTTEHFVKLFDENARRFRHGEAMVKRFIASVEQVRKAGRGHFRTVDENHNELSVAEAILRDPRCSESELLYEPSLPNTEKTIDFMVTAVDGVVFAVDIKTIKPAPEDRWKQYQKAQDQKWFPQNVQFILEEDGLGGELWHAAFSSRAKFLDYALELEGKAAVAGLDAKGTRCILMLCGEGFHWRQDELEDFVAYYRSGRHRADDPFSKVEEHYIADKGLKIQRSIYAFACLDRRQGEVSLRRVNWYVQPPRDPFARAAAV